MDEFKNNNRRDFLRKISVSAAGIALGGLPLETLAGSETVKITILHTNDMHSRIEPFPADDVKWAGLGGMARRSTIIKKIRSQEKNILLLDVGDIFQGTPYFNYFGGELEYKLMSEMEYDASTIGNHDFDNGMEGILKQLPHASFPFLCANYDFNDTPLKGKTQPYKIFRRDKVKIGVFGLGIELQGLVEKKMYGNTVYLDPLKKAAEMSSFLKNEMKCHLVICLSHLGYKYKEEKVSDEILASQCDNIDLILGGHTHTFLDNPVRYKNKSGKEVLVAQVGWAGIKLGRIDYYFEKKSSFFSSSKSDFDIRSFASVIKVSTKSIGN